MRTLVIGVAFAASLAAAPVSAQYAGGWSVPVEELRFGAAISSVELMVGSMIVPDLPSFSVSNLDSVTFEAMFRLPDVAAFRWLGSPRFEVGGVLNMRGRESVAHAGFNWHIPLFDTPLFVEAGLGIGIHNAALEGAPPPLRNVGCNPLLHWSLAAGADIDPRWRLVAKLQHVSHATVCGDAPNEGINNFGVSLAYRF